MAAVAVRPVSLQAVTPYSCVDGSWQGDANFTGPTDANAITYKKMSESFQKLAFDEQEFLRCGYVASHNSTAHRKLSQRPPD